MVFECDEGKVGHAESDEDGTDWQGDNLTVMVDVIAVEKSKESISYLSDFEQNSVMIML